MTDATALLDELERWAANVREDYSSMIAGRMESIVKDLRSCVLQWLPQDARLKALQGFWNDVSEGFMSEDQIDLDGGDFENIAAKNGLLERVPYDPAIHGKDYADDYGMEKGEAIMVKTALCAPPSHPTLEGK